MNKRYFLGLTILIATANHSLGDELRVNEEAVVMKKTRGEFRHGNSWLEAGTKIHINQLRAQRVGAYLQDGSAWVDRSDVRLEVEGTKQLEGRALRKEARLEDRLAYCRVIDDASQGVRLTTALTQSFPNQFDVWRAHASFLHLAGKPNEAVAAFERAIELGDRSSATKLSLSDALFVSGQRRRAMKKISSLLQDASRPIYPDACLRMCEMLEPYGG